MHLGACALWMWAWFLWVCSVTWDTASVETHGQLTGSHVGGPGFFFLVDNSLIIKANLDGGGIERALVAHAAPSPLAACGNMRGKRAKRRAVHARYAP